ncbi:hypothetical protein [Methylobacterium aquaticum]|uniref:hypothetical protein n=1 Tax=Methylobacterium aquaticum TaxID=270351 RepID=UPI0019320A1D|nr:hypothetical protein [Methylobacterium aquaticum]QRE75745.1 hypothetical protein F1D61_21140 [Methylobacterium aquaticum]
MTGERGYLDTDTVTAADIRRAWPHMREACGLVSTSACRDELIRQAVRFAKARRDGWIPPSPDRPNRAALFEAAAFQAPTPTLKREGQS